jgi:hypothetical protein
MNSSKHTDSRTEIVAESEVKAAALNERARADMPVEELLTKARLFVRRSNEAAAAYLEWFWMLGEALTFAYAKSPEGEWRRTLKALHLNHESDRQARAIYREVHFEDLPKYRNKTRALRSIGYLPALSDKKAESPVVTAETTTAPDAKVETPTTDDAKAETPQPSTATTAAPLPKEGTGQPDRPQGQSRTTPTPRTAPTAVAANPEPEPVNSVQAPTPEVPPTWHIPEAPFDADNLDSPVSIEWLREAALYLDWLVLVNGLTVGPADHPDAFRVFKAVVRAYHARSRTA